MYLWHFACGFLHVSSFLSYASSEVGHIGKAVPLPLGILYRTGCSIRFGHCNICVDCSRFRYKRNHVMHLPIISKLKMLQFFQLFDCHGTNDVTRGIFTFLLFTSNSLIELGSVHYLKVRIHLNGFNSCYFPIVCFRGDFTIKTVVVLVRNNSLEKCHAVKHFYSYA